MQLSDLLTAAGIEPRNTLVLRHRPSEPSFRKALPLLAGGRLDLFEAYQNYQGETVERSIAERRGGWIASFLAYGAGKAVFVGLYRINSARTITRDEFWAMSEQVALKELGNPGWKDDDPRNTRLYFDLQRLPEYADWRGKLVVQWPPPERGWFRRAHKNEMGIVAIREESAFLGRIPTWDEVDFTWAELKVLPSAMRAALAQWRGVYLIWDSELNKSYVGSAYGGTNILGRWENYAATGHGANKLLRACNPANFRFTVLQRVSPDLEEAEVIRIESTWKSRLHTRAPHGLNDN